MKYTYLLYAVARVEGIVMAVCWAMWLPVILAILLNKAEMCFTKNNFQHPKNIDNGKRTHLNNIINIRKVSVVYDGT